MGIKFLDCSHNKITQLDNLPPCLKELYCIDNKITQLDNLPQSLEILNCSGNPLQYDFKPTLENIRSYVASHG